MPNHVVNHIELTGNQEDIDRMLEYIQFDKQEPYECYGIGTIDFNKIIPQPEFTNGDEWYDWNIENWGTKWNAYEQSTKNENELNFWTAWSAPEPVIRKLAEMFPEIYFVHQWADEDIGNNCGETIYSRGYQLQTWYGSNDRESVEFSCELWGEDSEEYLKKYYPNL